ncbi:MAG: ATP-binding cassette domain-containing protein [bacterium]
MSQLTFEDLTIGYGYTPVLKSVSGSMESGEWIDLWGDNGEGKTTLLKVLSGLKQPFRGEVKWDGESLSSIRDRYRRTVRYIGHEVSLFCDNTVRENWLLYVDLFGLEGTSASDISEDFPLDRTINELSQGERRRVELTTLFPDDCELFFLDEPVSSLDETSREVFYNFLEQRTYDGNIVVTASPDPVDKADENWEVGGLDVSCPR